MSTERDPLLATQGNDDDDDGPTKSHWASSTTFLAILIVLFCGAILFVSLYALEEANRPKYGNRVLLLRHGEKPRNSLKPGLSKAGRKRAQCLRSLLGPSSGHNIGYIMAESYDEETGVRGRPFFTVEPLATDLGLTVDVSCSREDTTCIRRAVAKFAEKSSKDVLICWKHSMLTSISQTLGSKSKTPYPEDRFDLLWVMQNQTIQSRQSEKCKGLDDGIL